MAGLRLACNPPLPNSHTCSLGHRGRRSALLACRSGSASDRGTGSLQQRHAVAVDERGAGGAQPADDALELVAAALERADKAAQARASAFVKQRHMQAKEIQSHCTICELPKRRPANICCRRAGCGGAVASR